jgi:hypothetical protein
VIYEEFVSAVKKAAGLEDWLMLTQEKTDIARGGKIFSVEAIVFGGHLQAMVRQEECTEGWIQDTVSEMQKTMDTLAADAQKRRDHG